MAQQTNLERLEHLLKTTSQPAVIISTLEEAYALGLVRDAVGKLGWPCKSWSVTAGLADAMVIDHGRVEDTERPAVALRHVSQQGDAGVYVFLDIGTYLDEADVMRALREALLVARERRQILVMIDHEAIEQAAVVAYAEHFEIHPPERDEIDKMVRAELRAHHSASPLDVDVKRDDWDAMVRNLRGLSRRQISNIVAEAVRDDRRIDGDDMSQMVARKRDLIRADGVLEFVNAPASLDDIGGLVHLKAWLGNRSLESDAEEHGLEPPRGVLLLGVQGAGKSLCAKAIATAWRRPLLRLDPSALYNRYIGESERRLRGALRQAELMSPMILWIDEIEKGFSAASGTSNDGGLSRRMFGTLLTWMQEHREPVFLVATANDIESLPPELMRKGRFDEIFFVDLPGDDARRAILNIHLRKRKLDPSGFDIDSLIKATDGFSGAEIEQAIISARHEAFAKRTDVTTESLVAVISTSPPLSVTMAERIASLQAFQNLSQAVLN
ncbi:MAG: AAA family ATPase [Planctomycetota bacterium]